MAFGPMPDVIRGRMSLEEKNRIDQLATRMKTPAPGPIAHKLNRHPATVMWYMLTHGLITRKCGHAPKPYKRRGKMIYPYSAEQDAFIVELRSQNVGLHEIAKRVTEKFGIYRHYGSVKTRLVQLATAPDEEAAS